MAIFPGGQSRSRAVQKNKQLTFVGIGDSQIIRSVGTSDLHQLIRNQVNTGPHFLFNALTITNLEPETTLVDQLLSRSSVSPKRQGYPAPTSEEIALMVQASLTVPDHCGLRPCHFLEIPHDRRSLLADIFVAHKIARDGDCDQRTIMRERDKAHSAPTLIAAYAKIVTNHPRVPAHEQLISAGAAVQNFLLCAHGLGYGGILLSGDKAQNPQLHEALGLCGNDRFIGFISIGTLKSNKQKTKRDSHEGQFAVWKPARSYC